MRILTRKKQNQIIDLLSKNEIIMKNIYLNTDVIEKEINDEFSATAARQYLIEGNKEKWMQCVNPKIHFMWDELRQELLSILC